MNIAATSSSNQLPEIYATQYGVKPLSEEQKLRGDVIDKNIGFGSFPEPKNDLLSKLLGGWIFVLN